MMERTHEFGVEFSYVTRYDNYESAAIAAEAYGGKLVVFFGEQPADVRDAA